MSANTRTRDFDEADYIRRMEERAAAATGVDRLYSLMCAGVGTPLTRMRFEANKTGDAALTEYSRALQAFTGAMYACFVADHIDPADRVAYIEATFTQIANDVIRNVDFWRERTEADYVQ